MAIYTPYISIFPSNVPLGTNYNRWGSSTNCTGMRIRRCKLTYWEIKFSNTPPSPLFLLSKSSVGCFSNTGLQITQMAVQISTPNSKGIWNPCIYIATALPFNILGQKNTTEAKITLCSSAFFFFTEHSMPFPAAAFHQRVSKHLSICLFIKPVILTWEEMSMKWLLMWFRLHRATQRTLMLIVTIDVEVTING